MSDRLEWIRRGMTGGRPGGNRRHYLSWRISTFGLTVLLLGYFLSIRPSAAELTRIFTSIFDASPADAAVIRRTSEIDPERELVIRGLSVVNDARAQGTGPWSFGTLMKNLAPAGMDPAVFTENWFRLWIETAAANPHDFYNIPEDAESNPDPEAALDRAAGLEQFLSNWPRRADGKLDLAKSPFRLLAVLNRLDLNEGRLAFSGIVANTTVYPDNQVGDVLDLAVIFEYQLPPVGPTGTVQDAAWWANQWHDLARYPLPSTDYLKALERLTNRFTGRGVMPGWTNGSALKALRTNEQTPDLGFGPEQAPVWQCAGFRLSSASGLLHVEELPDTPHYDYNAFTCGDEDTDLCQDVLVEHLLENKEQILAGTWRLDPAQLRPTVYAPEFRPYFSWLSNVEIPEGMSEGDWDQLRFAFSNVTCNGCHSHGRGFPDSLQTPPHEFMQVGERDAYSASALSPFVKQQIEDVRIPHMLSYIAPRDPRARRIDFRRRPVH